MNLESRVSELEAKQKPNRLLVVWANRGETISDVKRREGIGPNDSAIFLIVDYDKSQLEFSANA